jgi:hypothetical protein
LAPFVRASGINRFNECYHSDHRALFFDIDLKAYLGHILPTLARPDQRFVSTGSRHVTKFVAKVHSHLHANKVLHTFQEYSLDATLLAAPWQRANDIDDMLGQALDTAERACSSVPQHPWSENLHKASIKVRYWKTYLTARTTAVPQDDILAELAMKFGQTALPPPPPIPMS